MNNSKKILLCDNTLWGLVNFRGYVIHHFVRLGFEVVLVAPQEETSIMNVAVPKGVRYIPVKLNRCSRSPIDDLKYYFRLRGIYMKEHPDYIFHYTVKPNIYGTFAAHSLGIPCTDMVPGLGYALMEKGLMSKFVLKLYRSATKRAQNVMVLNQENYEFLLRHKFATEENTYWLRGGEGVDLKQYPFTRNGSEHTTFLMMARVLEDKGYREFVSAARIVKEEFPNVRFQLLGPMDTSYPNHITQEEIGRDVASGVLDYIGVTNNVQDIMHRSGIVIVLPSYHEGLSRSLMEACAMGKPIIASDIPGCREAVREGENGFLVEPKSASSLVEAMFKFLDLTVEERVAFSKASRKLAETVFDKHIVLKTYCEILKQQGLLPKDDSERPSV